MLLSKTSQFSIILFLKVQELAFNTYFKFQHLDFPTYRLNGQIHYFKKVSFKYTFLLQSRKIKLHVMYKIFLQVCICVYECSH